MSDDPSGMPVRPGEVACLLGYQDTSSFYRAFRDWEGVTPNQWRELNAAAISFVDGDHAFH